MHGAVCPMKYSGHLTERISIGSIAAFEFLSDAGMRAYVVPALWTRSEISSIPGMGTTISAEGIADQSGFHLSEVRTQGPPLHAKAAQQLRLWEKLGVEVSVAIHQTFYELFFLSHVRELQPDIFVFRIGDAAVLVGPNKCQHVTIDAKVGHTTITMLNIKVGLIKVSDSPMDTLVSLAQWGIPPFLTH